MSIYVEIKIRDSLDTLWRYTQDPKIHEQWDLRFTNIEYLPRESDAEPQRFRYTTRIGFGFEIRGEGESVGSRDGDDGERTSSLKFASDDGKSLIEEGSGYWKYIPTEDGIRFLTLYNYRVRFGVLGRAFDRLFFKPLMGWATAWSFDRLRMWIESGIHPAVSMQRSLMHALARVSVAFVWLYHGLVPKIIFRDPDEMFLLESAGVPTEYLDSFAITLGGAEVVLGLLFLFAWRRSSLFILAFVLMLIAILGVAVSSPEYLSAAFNPVTLNVSVMALCLLGWIAARDLPSARRCLRSRPEDG